MFDGDHGQWKLETNNKVGRARDCLQTMGAPQTLLSAPSVPPPIMMEIFVSE